MIPAGGSPFPGSTRRTRSGRSPWPIRRFCWTVRARLHRVRTLSLRARVSAGILAAGLIAPGLLALAVDEPGAGAVMRRVMCTFTDEDRTAELKTELAEVLAAYDPHPVRVGSCRYGADVGVEVQLTTSVEPGPLPRPKAWIREVTETFQAHGWVHDGVLRSGDGRYEARKSVLVESAGRRAPDESVSMTVTIFFTGRTRFGIRD